MVCYLLYTRFMGKTIDKKYKELIQEIYYNGFEYEDPNRKGVIRKQITSYRLEHNFKDGFPIIGLKQSYPRSAFNEMLLFMRGKTNIKDFHELKLFIWDKDEKNYNKGGDLGRIYPYQIRNFNGYFDQLNFVLERLKKEPHRTKNVVTMWNPCDMEECALTPCHRDFEFISDGKNLTVQFTMSSVDSFLGLPMNLMYYSFVCLVFSHYLGLKPKGIIANLSNVHLYDNSFEAVEELLIRELDNKVVCIVSVPPEWDNLDDYLNKLNFELNNYVHLGKLNVEMLAYDK